MNLRLYIIYIVSTIASATATAQNTADTIVHEDVAVLVDTVEHKDIVTIADTCIIKPKKKSFLKRLIGSMYEFVKDFSRVDKEYIEPQAFNYTVMMQNTYTYELYRITSSKGNDFTFAPLPSIKLGPYLGWRWVFLGYTFDLKHISNGDKWCSRVGVC